MTKLSFNNKAARQEKRESKKAKREHTETHRDTETKGTCKRKSVVGTCQNRD